MNVKTAKAKKTRLTNLKRLDAVTFYTEDFSAGQGHNNLLWQSMDFLLGWDGSWIVSKSGIDDYAASTIDRLNGEPVNFCL